MPFVELENPNPKYPKGFYKDPAHPHLIVFLGSSVNGGKRIIYAASCIAENGRGWFPDTEKVETAESALRNVCEATGGQLNFHNLVYIGASVKFAGYGDDD